jgi:hypothetical protein
LAGAITLAVRTESEDPRGLSLFIQELAWKSRVQILQQADGKSRLALIDGTLSAL